jgi:uncharacterized protein (TIGR03000 family)
VSSNASYAAASAPKTATVIVDLPADAKLYFDDQLTKTTAAQRTFTTPELDPGQNYYYVLRAEVERDGKTYTEKHRVTVKAGGTSRATFNELANAGKGDKPLATAAR